jgi:hypothetical protein
VTFAPTAGPGVVRREVSPDGAEENGRAPVTGRDAEEEMAWVVSTAHTLGAGVALLLETRK